MLQPCTTHHRMDDSGAGHFSTWQKSGARGESRTPMTLRSLPPQGSASAISPPGHVNF